jgi:hypothetical protein
MMKKSTYWLIALAISVGLGALMACGSAFAQEEPVVLAPEQPFNVDAAIARGLNKQKSGLTLKDKQAGFSNVLRDMSRKTRGSGATGYRLIIHTPETWVQYLGWEAADTFMPLTQADLTAEDLAPYLRVTVLPKMPRTGNVRDRRLSSDVKHIVVRDAKKKAVLQPVLMEPFEQEVSNALGGRWSYFGVQALFDLAEVEEIRRLDKKGELHVTIVGTGKDKDFKIKTKHFKHLRWRRLDK